MPVRDRKQAGKAFELFQGNLKDTFRRPEVVAGTSGMPFIMENTFATEKEKLKIKN